MTEDHDPTGSTTFIGTTVKTSKKNKINKSQQIIKLINPSFIPEV